MNAPEAEYNLDRAEAALRTLRDALEHAEAAMSGEVRNATRWALIDVDQLAKKIPRLRAWVRAGGPVDRVA